MLLKTQEKFYLAAQRSDIVAAMLENVVYLELLRREYDVCLGKIGNAEIDFVLSH